MVLWKGIMRWLVHFAQRIFFNMGDGRRVRFWLDPQCGYRLLQEVFLGLNQLITDFHVNVGDYLEVSQSDIVWNPQFQRAFKGGHSNLQRPIIQRQSGGHDLLAWRVSKQVFSVQSLYWDMYGDWDSSFPWKGI